MLVLDFCDQLGQGALVVPLSPATVRLAQRTLSPWRPA
jgi:hypothetical protein